MAETPNSRENQSDAIQAALYALNAYLDNAAGGDTQRALQNARTGTLPTVTPNITIDTPADRDATLASPSYKRMALSALNISRKLVRATYGYALLDVVEAAGGRELDRIGAQHLLASLNNRLNVLVAGTVSGLTFDTVNGSGNDNQIVAGDASNFIASAFPYAETGKGYETFAHAVIDAMVLLWDKNIIAGSSIGSGAPLAQADVFCPSGLAKGLVRFLIDSGLGQPIGDRAAVQGTIATGGGILAGTWGTMRVVPTNATGVATSTKTWAAYVIPRGGVLQAAVLNTFVSPQRYEDGNLDTLENRFAYNTRWAAAVPFPTRVIQITMHQKASVEVGDAPDDKHGGNVNYSRFGRTTDEHDRIRWVHPDADSFISTDLVDIDALPVPDATKDALQDHIHEANAEVAALNGEVASLRADVDALKAAATAGDAAASKPKATTKAK